MGMRSSLKHMRASLTGNQGPRRPRKMVPSPLQLERLEDRLAPSCNPGQVIGGQLTVNCDSTGNLVRVWISDWSPEFGSQSIGFWNGTRWAAVGSFRLNDTSITGMQVNTGAGANTVRVEDVARALVVEGGGGHDNVTIGNNGSLRNILAAVTVRNPPFFTELTVDNSADTTAHDSVVISATGLTGLAPAPINWVANDLGNSLTIRGGNGSNTYTILDTPQSSARGGTLTTLTCGTAIDRVNVRATTGNLHVEGGAGDDTVNLGNPTNGVQSFRGDAVIANAGGHTVLNINDTGNSAGRTARQSLPGAGFAIITGLAPQNISYRLSQTGPVNITLGSGADTFTFENTNTASLALTTLNTGPGNDTVNVQRTTGPLTINLGTGDDTVVIGQLDQNLDRLLGIVSVNARSGSDALFIDDQANTRGDTWTLNSDGVSAGGVNRTGWPGVNYSGGFRRDFVVNAGPGGSTFNLLNTHSWSTTLNTGRIDDTVNVLRTTGPLTVNGRGPLSEVAGEIRVGNAGSVDSIRGPLTITNAQIKFNDNQAATARAVTITSSGLTWGGPASVALSNAGVEWNGGPRGNTFNVQGNPGAGTILRAGAGTNTVTVGTPANTLDGLGNSVVFGGGTTVLVLNDQGSDTGHTYTLEGATFRRSGGTSNVVVNSRDLASVTVNAGNGDNTLQVNRLPGGSIPFNLNGGGGTNTLQGPDSATTWQITGNNAGSFTGGVSFTAMQNLLGGAGADTFVFSDGAGVSGRLDGGSGTNALDYSAYAGSNVLVNLPTGSATGVGGSIANFRNVTGASGGAPGSYNVLIGNGGNVLTGGNGRRNLLVAGASASTLIGGNDDDILIAGTTDYDTDPQWQAAFTAIMNEWTQATDYATRVDHLMNGGGLNDPFLLNGQTVHSNGGGNTLTGHGGGATELNLYFANLALGDTTDQAPDLGEQLITIV